ncbi:stathmin-like 4, like [Brienomyrus brachyistius]|uniref:stathmin-like 4, like n=1 Tax=Brienomyrus brachyistius TaxID=42636 RepID=UPI0020B1AE2F|nr:stathmin-like 4, like [Brienomyrus brachyistius]
MFNNCGKMTLSAYKEKMKELPLVSLFCTCLLRDTQGKPQKTKATADVVDLNLCVIKDMEVIELNKRVSGQAFEVILKPPSFGPEVTAALPQRGDPSLGQIQRKLTITEERRKCEKAELLEPPVEEREQKTTQKYGDESPDCEHRIKEELNNTEAILSAESQQEKVP